MARKQRDLLEVLKLELEFLRNGGYRQGSSWRPRMVFEDSPTCLNYRHPEHLRFCNECVMMQLVPEQHRSEKVPCRYIPINQDKQTIQSMYATETPEELEAQLTEWLMSMIQRLEVQRAEDQVGTRNGVLKSSVGRA